VGAIKWFIFMGLPIEGGATIWARQTIESEVFANKPDKWFKIWFYLINRVSFQDSKRLKRGELFLKYEWICQACCCTKGQLDKFLRWAKSVDMLSTQKSTRGMIVKINRYSYYQQLDNYYTDVKVDTENGRQSKQSRNKVDTILKNEKKYKNIKKATVATLATTSVAEEGAPKVSNDVNEILEAFQMRLNPTISYGNKTQRGAIEYMLKQLGKEKVLKAIEYCAQIQGDQFAPIITTPYQLKEKWAQLGAYHKKQVESPNKVAFIS
jgi:uncharacterized protein YerC